MTAVPPTDPAEIREQRAAVERLREKYPDKVPLMLSPSCAKHDMKLARKYLVYQDSSFGKFNQIVRQRAKINPTEALFFYVNETLVPMHSLICELYDQHAHENGLLYIVYAKENTFG